MRHLVWFKTHLRIVLVISIVVGCAPAYLHAYSISPGGISEVPTILAGDLILVNSAAHDLRLPYSNMKLFRTGSPRRGEMVLIAVPGGRAVAPKRVIGIPGDAVEFRESHAFVNGQALPVEHLDRSDFAWVPGPDRLGALVERENGYWISYTPGKGKYRNIPLVQLAADQYFLVGDNRDVSADSRIWGPLSRHSILGRVILTLSTGKRL